MGSGTEWDYGLTWEEYPWYESITIVIFLYTLRIYRDIGRLIRLRFTEIGIFGSLIIYEVIQSTIMN